MFAVDRHACFMNGPGPTLRDLSRQAIILVLCHNANWRLSNLADYIDKDEPYSDLLGSITIEELLGANESVFLGEKGEPIINRGRLIRATQAEGEKYDRIVLEVIQEARRPVAAAYLERRVGGPRWKRQASLRRLVAAGASSTSYRTAAPRGQA